MKKSYQAAFITIIIASLLITATVNSANADEAQGDKSDNYRKLLKTIDGAVRRSRLGGNPSGNLSSAKSKYNNLVDDENLSNLGLVEKDNQIRNTFDTLENQGENAKISDIRALKSEIVDMADTLGIDLPFQFRYALFIILGLSILLALGVTLINRVAVDWEKVNKAKAKMQDWQKKLRKAQRKGKKKEVRKLKRQQSEIMGEQKTVMVSMFKPMIFYIIPYILFWWWMNGVFGGWVVAWLPFNLPWPDFGFRLFSGTVASVGFLGWYLLSYFGFAQIWRRFLIPSK